MKPISGNTAVALGTAIAIVCMADAAAAQSRSFDIPQQPVRTAIGTLGAQADIQILASAAHTKGKTANAVRGVMTVDQALSTMLRGTGLTVVRTGTVAYTVVPLTAGARTTGFQHAAVQSAVVPAGQQMAQDVPVAASPLPASAPAEDANSDAGDIVVTAEKREQSLQKVPAAVTVLSADKLRKFGTTDISQVATLAPSLRIAPIRTQSLIFLRGVGQTLTTTNADPAIAVNVNGVYVPNEMSGTAFYDLERVEVLPGPQGTLYGRNATGGVINVITRHPKDVVAGEAFLEYGNYDRIQAFMAADVPVSDSIAIRGAFNVIRHDGFYDNGSGDQDSIGARLTAVLRPTDTTTITAIGSYSSDGGVGTAAQNVPPLNGKWWSLSFDPKLLGYKLDIKTYQASLQVDQELSDAVTLTYIGGYNRLTLFSKGTAWAGPPLAPLTNINRTDAWSHELRLAGSWDRLGAIGGLYYFDIEAPYGTNIQINANLNSDQFTRPKSEGQAAFGQLTYSVLDTLRLTGGLRYSRTTKELAGIQTFTTPAGASSVTYNGRIKENRLDWKAAIEYDMAQGVLVYGSVATGFTPGGLSDSRAVPTSPAASSFEPVKLLAYAGGFKSRLFDNALTLNVEAFYYDYKNYQVSARNILGVNQVFNAEKARIYGVQADSRLRVGSDGDLTLGIGYLQANAIRLRTAAGVFDGFRLPYSPRWSVNAGYTHSFELADGGSIEPSVNFQYTSGRWGFYTHAPGSYLDGKTKTDVDLTYRNPARTWSVSAWARNLENSVILTSGLPSVPTPTAFNIAPPRTYGMRLSFKY